MARVGLGVRARDVRARDVRFRVRMQGSGSVSGLGEG